MYRAVGPSLIQCCHMNVDHRVCRTRSMAIIGVLFYLQSRLKPGRMLLVDTEEKKIIQDVELKLRIARSRPHSKWLKEQVAKRVLLACVITLVTLSRLIRQFWGKKNEADDAWKIIAPSEKTRKYFYYQIFHQFICSLYSSN